MARRARELNPDGVEGHYYYAVNVGWLADADWVIEVVIENLKIKQELFAKVEKVVKAPQNPIMRNMRAPGPRRNFSSASTARKPIAKQPRRLTISVPNGKAAPEKR